MDREVMTLMRERAKAKNQPLVTFKVDERTMSDDKPGGRANTEMFGPVDYQRALTAYKILINSPLDAKDRKIIADTEGKQKRRRKG